MSNDKTAFVGSGVRIIVVGALWLTAGLILADGAEPEAARDKGCFTITVVDEQTGRGVPLVELRTVNSATFYTDSNGIVAFDEPGLMGRSVFFFVQSPGYEFARDGFGMRGKALLVKPGGQARLKIKRLNVAQRLYRLTGGGIYRDSILAGHPVPLRRPLLNAQVLGSDSVQNAVYHGRIYWCWGDTSRPSYPLGNFDVPGATSRLPSRGGLDPDVGVDLDYFVDQQGFARPTAHMPGAGPTWLEGLTVVPDRAGKEHLMAAYMKVRPPMTLYARGLAEFDDAIQQFRKVADVPLHAPCRPGGHPLRDHSAGRDEVYFAQPFPLMRVRATADAFKDLSQYEAFTCLKQGSTLSKPQVERDPQGRVVYGWKRQTPPVGQQEATRLIRAGLLRPHEALIQLRERDTGKPVVAHSGSVYWNPYRHRWLLLAVEIGGTSFLGEVWYAEADTPLGPWVYAIKVASHDHYSFYNPKQDPMFDKDGGRIIYFEGTYSHSFSGNPHPTPRYDYNQLLYKLDLADSRLMLPVPVYELPERRLTTRAPANLRPGQWPIAFFALDRPAPGTVAVVAGTKDTLKVARSPRTTPLFYALAPDTAAPPASTVPLYEWTQPSTGRRVYRIEHAAAPKGFHRAAKPLCRVWSNPYQVPATER